MAGRQAAYTTAKRLRARFETRGRLPHEMTSFGIPFPIRRNCDNRNYGFFHLAFFFAATGTLTGTVLLLNTLGGRRVAVLLLQLAFELRNLIAQRLRPLEVGAAFAASSISL